MIRLRETTLPANTAAELAAFAAEVTGLSAHGARVEHAATLWARKNRQDNKTFRVVRQLAFEMCSGPRRCGWCEDSCADELDHILPKYHYPERAFIWLNLLASCGKCNSDKRDAAAVFESADDHRWTRLTRSEPPRPPPAGISALIDPRVEDPLEFLELDLAGSFVFGPHLDADARTEARARFTIEALRLNERDYLIDARRAAFKAFWGILTRAVQAHEQGRPEEVAEERRAIALQNHPTVWAEMKRQRTYFPELANLFDRLPEALDW